MHPSQPLGGPFFASLLSFLLLISGGLRALIGRGAAPAAPTRAVLSFAGDCTLGSDNQYQHYTHGFVYQMGERGFDYPFSGVASIFGADDLTIVNLEGTYTDSKKPRDKAFTFRAPPAYAKILRLGSVEAVSVANNHILDFGIPGRRDTIAALDRVGVKHFGGGDLAIYEANGIRICMTAFTYPHWRTLETLRTRDIPLLRAAGCDIVILSMHAGTEEQYKITGVQADIARGAIDLGVDIVFGHHPHVVQAVEVYRGKPIFYSLGNFSFGGNIDPKDWDTLIGQVVVEKSADGARPVEMRIIPCLISDAEKYSDFRPVVATGERAEAILAKIAKHSLAIDPAIFETGTLALGAEAEGAGANEMAPEAMDAMTVMRGDGG